MIHKVFTVFDSKAEIYLQPFMFQTKGQAVRVFQDSANDENHQFNKHAEDFTLFELGEYDDNTAQFKLHDTPAPIGKAIEFLKN